MSVSTDHLDLSRGKEYAAIGLFFFLIAHLAPV